MNIPGYTIEREIGLGGMSTVFLAMQDSLKRPVALKIMSSALAADRTFSERFIREAQTIALLAHPNIVAIYPKQQVKAVLSDGKAVLFPAGMTEKEMSSMIIKNDQQLAPKQATKTHCLFDLQDC